MSDARSLDSRLPEGAAIYKALFLALVAAFVAVPLIATVLGGFKSLGELRTNPFGLPNVWEWQNYADILASWRYWQVVGQLAEGSEWAETVIAMPGAQAPTRARMWALGAAGSVAYWRSERDRTTRHRSRELGYAGRQLRSHVPGVQGQRR